MLLRTETVFARQTLERGIGVISQQAESDSTPQSLIEDLAANQSALTWERFLYLYQPLFKHWLRLYPVPEAERHDLVQETLIVVLRRISEFKHNGRTGAFRAWLKRIVHNQVLEYLRDRKSNWLNTESTVLDQLQSTYPELESQIDREHDQEVLRRLLQLTKPLVPPLAWEAFYRTAVVGEGSPQVARELGMTLNAVYIARSRVFAIVRRIGRGLVAPLDPE